jgi:hypothetical protein
MPRVTNQQIAEHMLAHKPSYTDVFQEDQAILSYARLKWGENWAQEAPAWAWTWPVRGAIGACLRDSLLSRKRIDAVYDAWVALGGRED